MFAFLFATVACAALRAAEPPVPPTRSVLFIGNSMIGKTMQHLTLLTKAAGTPWKITAVTKGGARLEGFAGDKRHDALGKIDEGGFTDVVFVQGTAFWFEGKPGDSLNINMKADERLKVAEKTLAAALEMHRHIAAIGARTVLYLGYPHKPAAERTAAAYAPLEAIHWTMKDRLDAAVIGGRKHVTLIVPNGPLWIRGVEHYDESTWYKDNMHGSDMAYYANAILFYACMSGNDPREIKYDGDLKPEEPKWVKEQAWDLAKNYVRPGNNAAK
jgi:hypothetical protein